MSTRGDAWWSREVHAASLVPLAFGAGVIHLYASIEHRTESEIVAGALLALAVLQIAAGWALFRRPTAALVIASGVGSLAIVALWTASRTVPVPLVEGTPEAVGFPDLAATVLEIALAAGAIVVLRRPSSGLLQPVAWALAAGLVAVALVGMPTQHAGHHVAHGEHDGSHLALHVGAIVGASAAFACVLVREFLAGRLRIGLEIRER